MARDHRKLRVFQLADALVPAIYDVTSTFPSEERFGLQMQLRRAAISVATNIVEGSARRSTREYVNFLNMANGSAAEALYLIDLAHRLTMLRDGDRARLVTQYSQVSRGLQAMMRGFADAD
jgi:four helix bundle protein